MDVEQGTLLKLKLLERQLTQLVDTIDKEITQTDVEWLHLKNVAETQNSANHSAIQEQVLTKSEPSNNLNLLDEAAINKTTLELGVNTPAVQDEEFDSD